MIGLIGKKVGMTQVFDEQGVLTPVTVIKVEPNTVIEERNTEKHGYNSIVLGTVDKKESRITKPFAGQFTEGVKPKKCLVEMKDFEKECKVGDIFGVELLEDLSFVDITGQSKGKGFQGVMKRHGFSGGRATHGSKFHRANGSTGMAATPSKTIKGLKMAGRMGGDKKTVQNLRVVAVDTESQVLLVKGAVPGNKDGFVVVKKAKKK
ncbi:50S ribosomal protein L3 [Spirochaeta cellobiosiphila]|uniref:50S ribosomal protein L3 n=1 Tax=Spirochaeta cellobiosiphila TaxID=504483 RepID=UPI000416CB28|nr:50S ribosomal protein L3 [Spirochaeta cellobiosiphila]